MYKLSIEFKNIDELVDFSKRMQGCPQIATVNYAEGDTPAEPTVTIDKPKKQRSSKKKEAPVEVEQEEEEMVEVESPYGGQAIPPVMEVQQQQAPQVAVGFNREGAIQRAVALIDMMKKAGVNDQEVMPKVHEVYHQAGCPIGTRISHLDDQSLMRFMPLFESKVQSIIGSKNQSVSFI